MSINLPRVTKQILRKTIFTFTCLFLFISNFLRRKELSVKNVRITENTVFKSVQVNLLWNVSGCHKIKVQNVGVFRGNSNGVTFNIVDINKTIEICFYGVHRKIKKAVSIEGKAIEILNAFTCASKLPPAIEIDLADKAISDTLRNLSLMLKTRQLDLKTDFKEIYFEFDSFNEQSYKPLDLKQL